MPSSSPVPVKIQLQHASNLEALDDLLKELRSKEKILNRIEALREDNPMLGLRGVIPSNISQSLHGRGDSKPEQYECIASVYGVDEQ